ncbi:MAG: hypothetical protein ABIK68_17755, partial [bacterium]
EISDYELQNQGISYSYKTLAHFKKQYPADHLFLILGEDSFTSFPDWVEIDAIMTLSKILVFPRPQLRQPKISIPFYHGFPQSVTWLDLDIPDISATQIRNSDIGTIIEKHWIHPSALETWKNCQQTPK